MIVVIKSILFKLKIINIYILVILHPQFEKHI